MPATKKATIEDKKGAVIVTGNIKSSADDPYFQKKAEQAKAIIKKAVLPRSK